MPNYDLYTELGLNKDMPPTEIGALLDGRINGLVGQGYPSNSPEVDQLATARAILSDPAKRNTYEAALAGPDGVIDVSWLHQLADSPAASSESSESSESSPVPSYDAASTSVINAAGDPGSSSSSSSSSEEEAGSSQSPYGQYSGYGQSQFAQSGQQGQYGQYGQQQFNSGNFGGPVQQTPAKAQFNTAQLSVAGRDRSQSKVYLACLGIMVIGMIYPLILMFTADDGDLSIFKGILFAIAHTAAWVGIAEIVWGVRRIVAPEEEKDAEDASSSDDATK
ncbi:hypothetical protein ACTXKY_01865 [Corynebacterium variabile]|uniref:J domain-containing protein n=2 Tax=Corynebacterium variabile TaxID=1727 RepID=A0A4Y4C1N8_9CORY|nr:hypothetical protein CVA01_22750 [Corynebacterium variabile]